MSIISNEERGWAFVHYAFVLALKYSTCYFWKVLFKNYTDMFVRFIVFNEIPY